jgi:hypothetical protein
MHVRIVTFTGATNIDAGIGFLREKVIPVLRDQKGYRGLFASAERARGVLGALTIWDTDAERDASWDALAELRDEAQDTIGGDMTVENFEQLLQEIGSAPAVPGSALRLLRVSMDPARVDEHLAFFRSDALPQIKAMPGWQAVRVLGNRETGHGITGTTWSDEAAMNAAAAALESGRQRAAARGMLFGETSLRQIVVADFG